MRTSTSLHFGKSTFFFKFLTFLTLLLVSSAAFSQQALDVQLVSKDFGGGYQIRCYGGANGAINSQVVGGVPPYTYNWSNGAHSPSINNLTVGNYVLTVVDYNGNVASASIELYQPEPIGAYIRKSEYGDYNISKTGANDGWAELKLYGGVNPNNVYWSNGQQDWGIRDVGAGTYTYTITDKLNCTANGSLTLTGPTPLSASVQILQLPAACDGVYGIVKANVTGGDPPYKFYWDNGSKEDTVFELKSGEHKFYVSDESGAEQEVGFELNLAAEKMKIILEPFFYPNGRNTSCFNCVNGSIQTTVIGGLAPFTYNWYPTNAATANIANLTEGDYKIEVTDQSGCKAWAGVYLNSAERDDWGLTGSNIDPNTQFIGSTNNADVIFKRNNLESLRLSNNGKVGIGVSNPQFGLDVNGTARFSGTLKLDQVPEITIPQEVNNAKIIVRGETNELRSIAIEDVLANMTRCRSINNGEILINWVPTPSLGNTPARLTAGTADCKPNVGIGTESPVTHLQVEGNTFTKKLKIGGDNYVFNHDFEVTGSSYLTGNFTSNLSANQSFAINQSETNGYQFLMSLNANNNNTKAIAVSNGSNTNSINTFNLYADGRMEIGAASTAYNNNTLLRVYGGVNIGADYDYGSLMSTLLKVNGMIATRKIKVLAGNIPFPDYVFDKNYSLLSLSETNKFIKNNKHLPGIPSAKEVNKNDGFDLGELQLKSLEKIEELYLHLIQLDLRIQSLEAENILLKKKLLEHRGTKN